MTTAQPFSAEDDDCIRGQTYLQEGDGAITNFYNRFAQLAVAMPNANAPVVAESPSCAASNSRTSGHHEWHFLHGWSGYRKYL